MDEPLLSPRAARTRSALISAGVDLLADRPVDAISIDEFVAAAGVAKGSFFNHFADKAQFSRAVTKEIRVDIEQWVNRINSDVADPLERLAGGMIAATAYAMTFPHRTSVLARSFNGTSLDDHPINSGLLNDLNAALEQKCIALPSVRVGVLYWLGACQNMMSHIVESGTNEVQARKLLAEMLRIALLGLSAPSKRVADITATQAVITKFRALMNFNPN